MDTIDFNVLAANFSHSETDFSRGDFSYDTKTDTIDFNLLVANFGKELAGNSLAFPQFLNLRFEIGGDFTGRLLDVL